MNGFMKYIIAIAMGITLIGCGATTKELTKMSRSERTDVFTGVSAEGTAPSGFVDLVIKASIKTHLEGYYILESKKSVHGKPGYPFLVNIDGQAGLWTIDGQKELIPLYDEKGKSSRDPDAGTGIKYNLEKKVRLAAGPHVLFFGLPGESYYTEVHLTLKEDASPVLEFKPSYRYKTRPTRTSSFFQGIDDYVVMMNGQVVR
jgi:hypothetical protein